MDQYVYIVADFCGGCTPVQGTFIGVFTDEKTARAVRDNHNKMANGGEIAYAWGSVECKKVKLDKLYYLDN